MQLPLFLRKTLLPVEVRLVLSASLEEVRRIDDAPDPSPGKSIGIDLVLPKVTENIFLWARNIKRDVHDGKPPRAVALWLIMNVARDSVGSGGFHVGPGRLSMQGAGLRAINSYCCDELEKLGEMTPHDRAAILKATAEEIHEAG